VSQEQVQGVEADAIDRLVVDGVPQIALERVREGELGRFPLDRYDSMLSLKEDGGLKLPTSAAVDCPVSSLGLDAGPCGC
jgi:hypothetical protein